MKLQPQFTQTIMLNLSAHNCGVWGKQVLRLMTHKKYFK